MRKNRFLFSITATSLITAILLSSCTAGRANSDASLQNSSASSAAGRLNSSLRTVASVPSGEISDKDEFLKGIWVDENGFVASFSENGRTAVFDEQTDEQTRKSVKITAQDKDTISISCEDKNYTAYHADSEKGAELCENLLTAASGDWSMCEYGYAQTVEIRKFTFLTSLGNDFSGDKITVGLEGVKLRNSLFESDGSETYARLDGDKLIFIFSYGDMVSSCTLVKKDSDEYNELTDAGSAINGVWVDPDDMNTTLTFFAGKSLTVTGNAFKEVLGEKFDSFSGKAYDISAKYKSDIINVYSGDDTLFSIVMYGSDILAVFADSSDRYPQILFYRENSDEIIRAKEMQKLKKEKADLLSAYPDNDNWLNNAECGDILSLADKDYIDKCVQNGYFTAGACELCLLCEHSACRAGSDFACAYSRY